MLKSDAARKARGLMARADHRDTPENEAVASRAIAEKLIRKHGLSTADISESGDVPDHLIFEEKPRERRSMASYANKMRNRKA